MSSSTLRRTARSTLSSLTNATSTLSSASSTLTTQLINLPTTYSTLIASNSQSITTIESSLRSLSYLLPGARLADSELASESLHSFIQLLSLYHDNLLKKRAQFIPSSPSKPYPFTHTHQPPSLRSPAVPTKPNAKPTLHYKYLSSLSSQHPKYTSLATLLKITEYTQLLWEMLSLRSRGGERSRWRIVVLLETFKAVLRLVLLRITGGRMLVSAPLPLREEFAPTEPQDGTGEGGEEDITEEELLMATDDDFPTMQTPSNFNTGVPTPPLSDSGKPPSLPQAHPSSLPSSRDTTVLPRTNLTLPPLPSPDSISSYLNSHILTSDDVKHPLSLLPPLTTLPSLAGEILYILRPLLYAVLMQRLVARYGYTGTRWKRIWMPWLIGLVVEYLSLSLLRAGRDPTQSSSPSSSLSSLSALFPSSLLRSQPRESRGAEGVPTSALEKEELAKRQANMLWWGMRGAFYENVTRGYVRGLAGVVRRGVPVVGELVAGVVEDYDHLWGEWVFCGSTL